MTTVDSLRCETCSKAVFSDDAIRTKTYGSLDTDRWQTLCCPTCGGRLKTVFVRDESSS